jgi:hypothetical protein
MDATQALNAASGVLFILVGLVVLRIAPREHGNAAFALFSGGFGARVFFVYLAGGFTEDGIVAVLASLACLGEIVYAAGLVQMARRYPSPLTRADRGLLALPAAVALAYGVAQVAAVTFPPAPSAGQAVLLLEDTLRSAVGAPLFVAVVLLFGLRFARARAAGGARERAQYALMAGSLLLYVASIAGSEISRRSASTAEGWALLASCIVVAAVWLLAAARSDDGRAPRNVALLAVGAPVVVAAAAVAFRLDLDSGPQFAFARVASVLVLAYAVVRHQLLGIEVKVRWTIQKSTVAAIFIGVFFVVSESAQQVFSGQFGPLAGIVAAGGLVFALAPLQRAAERLASAAVPVVAAGPEPLVKSRRDEVYRRALRVALRDRRLLPEERIALGDLAEELGIGAGKAMALMHEVEQEQRPGVGHAPRLRVEP